jgi:FKBP12-rapamycin complex-associated protein
MSIVGYRHLSNILFDQRTGAVVHIDFGECFDRTHTRDRYKEFVAFRLTRMMRAALGPQEHHWRFRNYCEETLKSIRDHHRSPASIPQSPIRQRVEIHKVIKGKCAGMIAMEGGKPIQMTVAERVDFLIREATDDENLCRMY